MIRLIRWWDGICDRCGLCCYEKHYTRYWGGIPPGGRRAVSSRFFIDTEDPCRYLGADRRCTIYHRRFKINSQCVRLTPFHALFCGYLPENCAYVKRFRFWRRWKGGKLLPRGGRNRYY